MRISSLKQLRQFIAFFPDKVHVLHAREENICICKRILRRIQRLNNNYLFRSETMTSRYWFVVLMHSIFLTIGQVDGFLGAHISGLHRLGTRGR